MVKGLIFDFNGTLLWDTPYHNKAWNLFLKKYNLQLSDKEIHENMHGKTNAQIFKYLFKKDFYGDELLELSTQKEGIYRDLIIADNFDLQKGVRELFDYCKHNNIPIAIATSSDQQNAMFYYKRYNLDKWFSLDRFVYNDYSFNGKPAPDIFIKAANQLSIKPTETMIFEDSPSGILAAENSNAEKIIIVNSTNDDYSQYKHQVINNFDTALTIVKQTIIQK